MSKMLGAGKKNDDNTFSGVLIGDVRAGTGNNVSTDPGTGVYGMHHGTWSFGLKEDGTAFLGKAGRGQIRLDGNTSTIQSAAYEEKQGAGMKIDLDDGIFHVTVDKDDRIYLSPGYYTDEYGNFHSAPYF
ncbi:MAG: hypothetical protein IKB70_08600 [Bacilli bacterium]|nr:hypothetical protein [Bacilli bacterium]